MHAYNRWFVVGGGSNGVEYNILLILYLRFPFLKSSAKEPKGNLNKIFMIFINSKISDTFFQVAHIFQYAIGQQESGIQNITP